jgi:8-amino-7-oxononanoate synthase
MLACGLQASLALIEREPQRREHLGALIRRWQAGVRGLRSGHALPSSTAIQPWVVGASAQALALSAALAERGLLVPAIRPPTVPAGSARLRISLSAAHTLEQLDRLCEAMHEIDARHG